MRRFGGTTDYADIAAAMRATGRRAAGWTEYSTLSGEVCGVPCNNPNHPQMAVAHEYSAQPRIAVVPEECPAELPYALQVKAASDLLAPCAGNREK